MGQRVVLRLETSLRQTPVLYLAVRASREVQSSERSLGLSCRIHTYTQASHLRLG